MQRCFPFFLFFKKTFMTRDNIISTHPHHDWKLYFSLSLSLSSEKWEGREIKGLRERLTAGGKRYDVKSWLTFPFLRQAIFKWKERETAWIWWSGMMIISCVFHIKTGRIDLDAPHHNHLHPKRSCYIISMSCSLLFVLFSFMNHNTGISPRVSNIIFQDSERNGTSSFPHFASSSPSVCPVKISFFHTKFLLIYSP